MALSFAATAVSALARRRGLLLFGRAVPFLGPLGVSLLLASAASSLLSRHESPFDGAPPLAAEER